MTVIAVIGAGAMGSGIGRLLVEGGASVITNLDGRSAATKKRAADAGMREAGWDEIVAAGIILSIIPPSEAVEVAETWLPHRGLPARRRSSSIAMPSHPIR